MGHETVSSRTRLSAGSLLGLGKKRIVAGVVAAVAVGTTSVANADIDLGKGFSISGFIDQSFCTGKDDAYLCGNPDGDKNKFGIDQFETDFMYAGSGGVSARVDIEYGDAAFPGGTANGSATFVEQAFVTKKFTDEFSVKLGRFLSYTGWEAEEPTGLFQWSGAGYAKYFYGFYQQGISAAYTGKMFGVTASVVDSAFNPYEYSTKDPSYELGVSATPIAGLTSKLFYTKDKKSDSDIFNFWTSYTMSGFTFAGEYNHSEGTGDAKGDGFLVMANYATGPWGITARFASWDMKNAAGNTFDKTHNITLSPSYKVGDNLLLVAEARKDHITGVGNPTEFALEALFSF